MGTPGDDVLHGTPGSDVIVGLDGRDAILGEGGDDIICGGGNRETLDEDGYPIDEYIDGGPGADTCLHPAVGSACENHDASAT